MWTAIHWPDGENRQRNTVQTPSVLVWWTWNGAIQQLGSIRRWPEEIYKLLGEVWKLCKTSLKQADRCVGAPQSLSRYLIAWKEFIAKLRILVKGANYPEEHNKRFLRDFLVLGMNSDCVRNEFFEKGNALSFSEAKEMAKAEESADKQLQLMNTSSGVHPVTSEDNHVPERSVKSPSGTMKPQSDNSRLGKSQRCSRNCGWGPHARDQCPARNATCHYCHKVGHLVKVSLSKLRKKSVH